MADYSRRHYGVAAWRLRNPRRVVLHYTAGGTAAGTRATFAANTPNRGELPGTCAHYVVDKNGDIYRLVPDTIRCRHAIGLNHVSLGIEMVQDAMSPPGAAERQILARGPQIRAALRLVRYLLDKHHLPIGAVIGHGTANDDRLFRDDEGWRNDHVDWPAPQVREFRRRLRGLR
jgi:N-acetyl-anhydromuramyl-L-alanine amidase AmpD